MWERLLSLERLVERLLLRITLLEQRITAMEQQGDQLGQNLS